MIPSATIAVSKPAGHLQVKKDRAGRAYWAFWRDAEGKHGRRLGPAHVKDSGRRTARGAVVWRAGDGSKPTPQHLTPKEAGAKLEEIVAGAPRSRPATQQGTLREACEGYAADRKRRNGLKPSTEMDYENLFGRLYRDFGADTPVADVVRRLREMNDRDESYIDTLKAQRIVAEAKARAAAADGLEVVQLGQWRWAVIHPAAVKTRRKYRAIFGAVLAYAVRRGWAETNPIAETERPGRDREEKRIVRAGDFYTPPEVERLLQAAPDPSFRALFAVGAYAGLRLGEMLDLRWGAVDFGGAVIRVYDNWVRGQSAGSPKDHESHHVPMSARLAELLLALRDRGWLIGPEDLVFPSDETGTHLGEKRLRRIYRETQDGAGLKRVRLHDLRHTMGTTAARSGIDLNTIMRWMGWSSLAMVQIYAHYTPHHDEARLIDRAFSTAMPDIGAPNGLDGFDDHRFFSRLEEELPAKWLAEVRRVYTEMTTAVALRPTAA